MPKVMISVIMSVSSLVPVPWARAAPSQLRPAAIDDGLRAEHVAGARAGQELEVDAGRAQQPSGMEAGEAAPVDRNRGSHQRDQATTNCPIMPESSCSRMWQWYMNGASTAGWVKRASSATGSRASTVSFSPPTP